MYSHQSLTKNQHLYFVFLLVFFFVLILVLTFLTPIYANHQFYPNEQPAHLSITTSVKGVNGMATNLPLGSVVTYTIAITNNGNFTATDVFIIDVLPDDITFAGFLQQGSALAPSSNEDTITWGPFDIPARASNIVMFAATINNDVTLYAQTINNVTWYKFPEDGFGSDIASFTIAPKATVYLPLVANKATPPSYPILMPLANSHTAFISDTLSITFKNPVNLSKIPAEAFSLYAMQSGGVTQTCVISGNTIYMNPANFFKPGELIQMSIGSDFLRSIDPTLNSPIVWQFRTGTLSGTGDFYDTHQDLSGVQGYDAALGDLDGDNDLDAIVGGDTSIIWFNSGDGTLYNTGQTLDSVIYDMALGDVDKDGDLDVFFAKGSDYGVANTLWLNDGFGSFVDSGQRMGYSNSQGVALGDLDGDGDLDAFVVNCGDMCRGEPNEVWLNNGAGNFIDSGQRLGNLGSISVVLGDVDGDWDLDAVVGNSSGIPGGGPAEVWLNDGTGRFSNSGQSLGENSEVALGDVNGDGSLDVLGNGYNKIWLNNGSGVFKNSGQRFSDPFSSDVVLDDIDGDNDLDAFLVYDYGIGGANTLWLNDGEGFFDFGSRFGDSRNLFVAVGDLDKDNDLDAFVGNIENNTVWFNKDDYDLTIDTTVSSRFSVPGQILTYTITYTNIGTMPTKEVRIIEFAPEELTSLSYTYTRGNMSSSTGSVSIWEIDELLPETGSTITITGLLKPDLNIGTMFTNTAIIISPMHEGKLSNNKSDVSASFPGRVINVFPQPNSHTANVTSPLTITIQGAISPTAVTTQTVFAYGEFQGHLDGTFSMESLVSDVTNYDFNFYATHPFHSGELVQISVTPGVQGNNLSFIPYVWQFRAKVEGGTGIFANSGQRLGSIKVADVAPGDVDGDGDLDAFFVGDGIDKLNEVWINDGTGVFTNSRQDLGNANSTDVALGDVDGDGDLDAFIGNTQQPNEVWLNNGAGIFYDSGQRLENDYSRDVALGDIDGDGDLDAVVANFVLNFGGNTQMWFNNGKGVFKKSSYLGSEAGSTNVTLGDADGDGDLDILEANYSHGSVRVWLNNGKGFFIDNGQLLDDLPYMGGGMLGDLDGDGDLDTILTDGFNNKIWFNDGLGNFYNSGRSFGWGSGYIALGDIDGDNDLDAFIPKSPSPSEVWLNDGLGYFSNQYLGPSSYYLRCSAIVLGDADGDGDLDVFVGNHLEDTSEIWINQN